MPDEVGDAKLEPLVQELVDMSWSSSAESSGSTDADDLVLDLIRAELSPAQRRLFELVARKVGGLPGAEPADVRELRIPADSRAGVEARGGVVG